MQLVSQITSLLSRRETLLNRLADIIIRACGVQFPKPAPARLPFPRASVSFGPFLLAIQNLNGGVLYEDTFARMVCCVCFAGSNKLWWQSNSEPTNCAGPGDCIYRS